MQPVPPLPLSPPALSQATEDLKTFLTTNLPKVKKEGKAKFRLGVSEPKLGAAIQVGARAAGATWARCCAGAAQRPGVLRHPRAACRARVPVALRRWQR